MPQKYSPEYYQKHLRPKKVASGSISHEGRGRLPQTSESKPDRQRRAWLKHRYGISTEQFDQMMNDQDGKCSICGKHFDKTPHVDHDHITGEVRSLLCATCNQLLGYAYEDVDILQNAINYLHYFKEV